jgi:hypothetical protein
VKTRWAKVDSQIIINQGMPIAARLFAIPLLAIAAYLVYQLVGAIIDVAHGFTVGALMESALGLALLLVLLLAFAIPGFFLLLGSKRVIVDAKQNQVIEVLGGWFWQKATSYSIEPYRTVKINYEYGIPHSTNRAESRLYTFDIVLADAQDQSRLLTMFPVSDLEQARKLGKEIADLLKLKLSDHSGKWDPAQRGDVPQDILPIQEWLMQHGIRGVPLSIGVWIARGVHFIVDQVLKL